MRTPHPLAVIVAKFVGLGAVLAAAAGCPAAGDEVHPPSDELFFPTGMAIAPDQGTLFVLSANSDLRYDGGALQAIDLTAVTTLAAGWQADRTLGEGCVADTAIPTIMQCPERNLIDGDRSVRLGNFATDVGVQALADGRLRLFAAVRGDPSLTWVDHDPASGELSCGGSGDYPECDDDHRLTRVGGGDDPIDLPPEPFDVYVNSAAGFVVTTHLSDGAITVVDAPVDGGEPTVSDALGGLFAADVDGTVGAAGVAGMRPDAVDDVVYVTSRSEARVQTLAIARPADGPPVAVAGSYFFTTGVLPSDDGRGIGFSADGGRAYIINRNPAMLQIYDTSPGPGGAPKNQLEGTVELCQQAANLAVADAGGGERVYVTCFGAGQVWVIDPESRAIEALVDVGRGPHGIVVSPANHAAYVSNFLEDTIAVIDLTPGAPSENRIIVRLGRPRPEGAD